MADGVNCYQSKARISLCRWSRNWSWPLKHLEFSQRARFVFLCEVDVFFWKNSLKRSVTFDIWHLTSLLCQKLCILRRWRPLKRSAVKQAWTAPWWISSRLTGLTVTWPHLHPLNKEGRFCLRQVLVENKRAHLLSRMIDIFEDRFYDLNCSAYLQCIFRFMMMLTFLHGTGFWWLRGSSSFTVSTELLSRGEGFGALQGEEKWSAVLSGDSLNFHRFLGRWPRQLPWARLSKIRFGVQLCHLHFPLIFDNQLVPPTQKSVGFVKLFYLMVLSNC